MKSLIIGVWLMALGIVSCSSCAKQDVVVADAAPPVPTVVPTPNPPVATTVDAAYQNLSVVLPGTDWKPLEAEGPMMAYISNANKLIVLLEKEETTNTLQQYLLMAIRGIKDSGGTFISLQQVVLNGHNFALLESSKNDVQVFMWVTLKQGAGYSLTCGGPNAAIPCSSIANTIKIN